MTQCDLRGVAERYPESHKDPRLKVNPMDIHGASMEESWTI